jgi:hypothetical protein
MRDLRRANGSAPDALKLPRANKKGAIASSIREIFRTKHALLKFSAFVKNLDTKL